MNIKNFKYIYFLGIGGIGMSSIARWFNAQGYIVGGYDKTETPLTQALQAEGMDIHYDNQVGRIPTDFYKKNETLVVLTPAIPKDNIELKYFQSENYTILKRAQVLGLITEDLITIAVAGTHGKTTTSSMIAHILKNAGANVSAFLGGITSNYNTNLLIGMPTEKIDRMPNVPPFGKHLCVVEADEYDRSFLTLFPDIAVVTSTDADHLDIYGEHEELKNSFNLFINQIKVKGHLVIHRDLTYKLNKDKIIYVHQYSGKGGDFSANNIRVENGKFVFDYKAKTQEIKNIELLIPGFHNVENAVAAINVCILLEVPAEDIKAGLESFMGVKRRFEYIVRTEQKIFIDDYAHHPTEIEAFLTSVKTLYPNKKLTCVFQPHLFSRTRDFADGFSKSLSIADEVILLDIYPAREKPIDGVDSNLILKKITSPQKLLLSKEDLLKYISTKPSEVLVTVGAGDIDALVPKIKDIILNEKN